MAFGIYSPAIIASKTPQENISKGQIHREHVLAEILNCFLSLIRQSVSVAIPKGEKKALNKS